MILIKDANMKFDLFACRINDANSMNSSDFILTVILIYENTLNIYALLTILFIPRK